MGRGVTGGGSAPKLCPPSAAAGAVGEEGWQLLPDLPGPPLSASEGPAVLVAVCFMLWPPPPSQEALVPTEGAWVGGVAPEGHGRGRGGEFCQNLKL